MSKRNEIDGLDFAVSDILDLDELLVSYIQDPVTWDFRDDSDVSDYHWMDWDGQEIFLGGADVSDGLELF
ncbi:MAG: hypothetical protein K6F95_10060 [Selenomonas sp.]|uniref:hypothetical protein n=1 Tax=Selenomonas sp. TaxID=2053611 RepID=UPI0025EEFF5A|nr:hypothetical protein [Selenomonas sp.]MCR5758232.1 hypothetical protein [Selenomonas sp.]